MAKVLAEHFREKKSYVALAKAISASNQLTEQDKEPVDRRKLKKIIEGDEDLVLSITELHALDRYLEPFGDGLAYNSLFLRANVLQTIADAGKPVTFFLGSKPVEDSRLNLDHWDVKALAEIQRGVSNFAPDVRFDIRDVLLHDDLKHARRSANTGKWTALLDDDQGPSLVCLGSSRATHASEVLLSKMFDITPFKDSPEANAKLPFHFVWPPDLDHVFPSAFRYSPSDLVPLDPKAAKIVQEKGASALEMGGEIYLDRHKQRKSSESYGVCVAQRRPGGQVWIVLAGVTGPATYAAARLAGDLALNLRPTRPGESCPPYWTAVRANVQRDLTRSFGSFLTVETQEILSGPHAWEES